MIDQARSMGLETLRGPVQEKAVNKVDEGRMVGQGSLPYIHDP